jgi:DNA-binding LytR/AlgR family response regulator
MLDTIIIEDEKPAARRLSRMLEKNSITPLVMLHSIADSIKWLQNNPHPDLIFLDIQLSDGLSFEIFEKVKIESAIIFTTAYDKYALKAFKLNSIDYLLKPIDSDELTLALNKFNKHNTKSNVTVDYKQIISLIQGEKASYKTRFIIQLGQHLKIVQTSNIICFFSEDKSSFACLESGKIYPIDGSVEGINQQLNPEIFYKVNRKFIIKMSAIKDIISYTNSRLEIKLNNFNNAEIIVSREKVKDFKDWLAR